MARRQCRYCGQEVHEDRWLTVADVQERLQFSRNWVYLLISRGDIPSVKAGRAVRIPECALTQWMAERERPSDG